MRLIAHRGNIHGPNLDHENSPDYVADALAKGFDCEIDLSVNNGQLLLGHEEPRYEIEEAFILSNSSRLWVHCKNLSALSWVAAQAGSVNGFWHEADSYTLTSQLFVWTYPGMTTGPLSVLVDNRPSAVLEAPKYLFGLCGDYVGS